MWQREITITVIVEATTLEALPKFISQGIADGLPDDWYSLDAGDGYRIAQLWQSAETDAQVKPEARHAR